MESKDKVRRQVKMAQFIQYLYEYENGKRVRNLGFMKVEKQMDKSIIQIYSKQIEEVSGIMFRREDGSKYYATWEEETEDVEKQIPEKSIVKREVQKSREMELLEENETGEEHTEAFSTYIPPSVRRFEKIQRQDLSRLPRKEWRLANNSFLLHGYHNYHHLLYIEDEGETWIGVPGIFHKKEEAAASAFGFTKFQRLTDLEVELSDEEKNTYEDFGYWCRQVESSSV